jgi:glyoxylase-like metal-dependent hydrolase (beta-lactamase superfamily II)
MQIHHINCGTSYNLLTPGVYGDGNIFKRIPLITHCLLVETEEGLLLVDTGFGTRDYVNPTLSVDIFTSLGMYNRDVEETALRQVIGQGYRPEDVRHIAITHMHLDHVGGLPDFPWANVHIFADEYQAITQPRNIEERFVCRREHWSHEPDWVVHNLGDDQWFGFDRTPSVNLGDTEFFLLPLPGHTRGHCGVVVRTPEGWLVHCGDSYVYHGDIHPEEPFYPPWFKTSMILIKPVKAFRALGKHSPRLRTLLRDHGDEVSIFCSHDPYELTRFQDGSPEAALTEI